MRGLLAAIAIAYTAFVVYGSLVPLAFRPMSWNDAVDAFHGLVLDPGGASRVDWATNVVLSIPMAFFWSGVFGPRPGRTATRAIAALGVFVLCLTVSVGVEFGQLFFPGRNPSVNDVAAQAIGEVFGITAWALVGTRFLTWLDGVRRAQGRMELAQRAVALYVVVLVGYNVLPLDLSVSPLDIYRKWRDGGVVLLPFTWRYAGTAQLLYELVTDVAIWTPVAFLWRISSGASSRRLIVRTMACAATIEFLQLFVMSRISDTTDILLAGVGGALGAWAAGRVKGVPVRGSEDAHAVASEALRGRAGSRRCGTAWPVLLIAIGAWLVLLAVVFWFPFDFDFEPGSIRRRILALGKVPLEAYWRSSPMRAATEVLHKTGFMFPLGVMLGGLTISLSHRIHRGLLNAVAILFVFAVAATIEAVQLALPGKNVDFTDWCLEAIGAIAGYWLCLLVYRRIGLHERSRGHRSHSH